MNGQEGTMNKKRYNKENVRDGQEWVGIGSVRAAPSQTQKMTWSVNIAESQKLKTIR